MTRYESKLYCYVGVGQIVPLPKKTRPGEWFDAPLSDVLTHNGLLRFAILGSEMFEAEHADRRTRLTKRIGVVNSTVLRLFMAACSEHVLDQFEKYHPGHNEARRAITAAMEHVATCVGLASPNRDAWDALRRHGSVLCNCPGGREALCAAAYSVKPVISADDARACASSAAHAIRADKRADEYVWQRKTFLKTIRQVAKSDTV